MSFTKNEKLKAVAIVNIFETSRPFGDYAALAVLDDGAGVSYGINQFTHRSGSLSTVVESYLNSGGKVGAELLTAALLILRRKSVSAINALASDESFKKALRSAAVTREMKAAQQRVMTEKYLEPALRICEGMKLFEPLSLAVVFDSLIHGSWERISRRSDASSDERSWITAYVRKRHAWLLSIPRLKATSYRTKFFLMQIAVGNWDLRLPVFVNGFRLTDAHLPLDANTVENTDLSQSSSETEKSIFATAGDAVSSAAAKFDRVDSVVATVTTRKDAAKSLWTTVIGTIWQVMWAVFGFIAGLPKEVWIVVAVIAALLMLLYLYRQIELGRIREKLIVNSE